MVLILLLAAPNDGIPSLATSPVSKVDAFL
jgi:hypothetical protein